VKLQSLKPRLQALSTARIAVLTARPGVVERKRGSAGVKDRNAIKERDCGLCQECQRHGAARPGSKVDHRIPLWDSGDDSDSNKQLMCDRCHEAKSKVEAGMRSKGESVPRPHGVHVPWDARSNAAVEAGQWRHGKRW
jgi:5-methylcytosine-specific restriction protein A